MQQRLYPQRCNVPNRAHIILYYLSSKLLHHVATLEKTPDMASRLSAWRHGLRKKPASSRAISNSSFITLQAETPVDEETLRHYDPEQFYPVHIGDLLKDRYQVAGKLGYGAYSTSWLCRDLRYVTSINQRKHPVNMAPGTICIEC